MPEPKLELVKSESLAEYAATSQLKQPGYQAWITTIPEYEEIVAAYRAGTPPTTILNWLREKRGYSHQQATHNTVGGWLYANVAKPR